MYVCYRKALLTLTILSFIYTPQVHAKSFLSVLLERIQASSSQGKKKDVLKNVTCQFSGYSKTTPAEQNIQFPIDEQNTVCDPLSNQAAPNYESGLLGKLILKTPNMSEKTTSVLEYHASGHRLEQNLYFADVNVPTQKFDAGFKTRAGDVLIDGDGNKLIENFAIEYSSSLRLQASDEPGHYEISLLSDDGSRLYIKENSVWKEIVNNDGEHATRMGCAFETVYLDHSSEIPMKILYYQGARYHVANVMMWKLHKKAKSWKQPARHSLCGFMGNSVFFNEAREGDTLAMKHLKRQGWSVVASQNFKMPESTSNPCVNESLTISDFKVDEVGAGYAVLSWKTNAPATSQIQITANNQSYTSPLDATLVTEHVVRIDGLESRTTYSVQAMSKDANGVEVLSSPPPISINQ